MSEEVQTDTSNGDLNHSQSKEKSNGDVHPENGTDHSKNNGHTHQSNGQMGPKPVNVAKSGLFSKLLVFLMLGSFFLATSVYVMVEYKDGPVAAVIESAISKEYAEVLIHHINDDLAPLVDSLKGSIREGIQKVTGQDLAGKVEDVEKSKDLEEDSSNNVDQEKVETKTEEEAEESKSSEFENNSKNIKENIKEETIDVRTQEPRQEDGKEKEIWKDPTVKVAEEKLKVEKTSKEESNLKKIEEESNILEAEKESENNIVTDELKSEKAEDKISKEESNLKKTEEEATRVTKDELKFQETVDITSKTTNDESMLKDTSNQARDELNIKEAEEMMDAEGLKDAEENLNTEKKSKHMKDVKKEKKKAEKEKKKAEKMKEAEENLGTDNMKDVKEVLKATKKEKKKAEKQKKKAEKQKKAEEMKEAVENLKNPYPPKEELKGEASKVETN